MAEDVHSFVDPRYVVFFRAWTRGGNQFEDECQAIVNPSSLKETMQAHYSLRPVLGLSHEVVQYIRTGSRKLSMELWLSYHILMRRKGQNQKGYNGEATVGDLLKWRNWFESLVVPAGLGQAPPLVSVDWPFADLNFMGVLESLNVDYERFDYRGAPMEMKLDLSMIEVVDGLMTTGAVFKKGIGGATSVPPPGAGSGGIVAPGGK